MTTLEVHIAADELVVLLDDGSRRSLPAGTRHLLTTELRHDPPLPEELTNAIGWVVDHLDDLVLERPDLLGAHVIVHGPGAVAVADVEVGASARLPFTLARDAAEDVFRTVATERVDDRRRNPGLSADLVDDVLAASCAVVGLMRRLRLDQVTIDRPDPDQAESLR